MHTEIMIQIENQKFHVSVRTYKMWMKFESEQEPDITVWHTRMIRELSTWEFNEFVSLLLAKQAELRKKEAYAVLCVKRTRRIH